MTLHPLASILTWFQKAVPAPEPRNQTTQTGVHLEEVAEMLEEIYEAMPLTGPNYMVYETRYKLSTVADMLKDGSLSVDWAQINRVRLLDALCDQIVTAVGIAHMLQLDILGAVEEVDRSNWSKFEDGEPLFDQNHKIIKGRDYRKAVLDNFV